MKSTKSTMFYIIAAIIFIALKFGLGLIDGNFDYYPAAPFFSSVFYFIAFALALISLIMSLREIKGLSDVFVMLGKYIWLTVLVVLVFYATLTVFMGFLGICAIVVIILKRIGLV